MPPQSPIPKPTQNNNNNNNHSPIESNRANSFIPPSNRIDLLNSDHGRILCIADLRGAISQINQLVKQFDAIAVIHSGDFGFYEPSSLDRISDRTLRHLIQYSSLITPQFRSQLLAPSMNAQSIRQMILSPPKTSSSSPASPNLNSSSNFALSEFPDLLTGKLKLDVPLYTVWGACEDVAILEKIRAAGPSVLKTSAKTTDSHKLNSLSVYSIPNLTVLDEATTRCLVIGGVRLRLFGLGGAVVPHKLFDNGEGGATIAGGQGTMWTSVLQVGELIDTAQRVYDPSETRLLISHASPGREGLLAQLALVLKADLTISAGLHFRYGVSYNEFSVQHDQEAFRTKLIHAKSTFNEIWDTVKNQVDSVIDDHQRQLLSNALAVANRVPAPPPPGSGAAAEEPAWKNSWNWNLPDAAYGSLVLDIKEGRIGAEMRSQGFNFAYRSQAQPKPPTTPTQVTPRATAHALNSSGNPNDNQTNQSATRASTATHTSQNHNPKPFATNSSSANSKNLSSQPPQSDSPVTSSTGAPTSHTPTRSQQQTHGSRHGSQGNSRHSNQYSNHQHRHSKSRDENRDDGPRTHTSSQSNPGVGGGDSGPKPASQARSKPSQDGHQSKNSINQQESSTQSASPVPSRKSSFANKKKKGSGSQTVEKKESEPTNQEKTDGEGETSTATTKNGLGSVGSNKESKGKNNKPEEASGTATEVNEKVSTTKPIPNSSDAHLANAVNGDNGNNHNNHFNSKGRFGSRGRGGSGPNNMRGNRGGGRGGGRGNDRDSFGPRPVGPGLVGAALADAGIGNHKSSNNTGSNVTIGAGTVGPGGSK